MGGMMPTYKLIAKEGNYRWIESNTGNIQVFKIPEMESLKKFEKERQSLMDEMIKNRCR